uniref:uncharacterized protein LOC122601363 n=1 Tax=Erigeron canadensis TaxID=72917 RepID=UPI001CB9B2F8|nr:uncharacterized protein LOC122601363 [Erigeron canadensis]
MVALDLDRSSTIPLHAMSKKIGKGDNTLFWYDVWIGNETLACRFARLFNLEQVKKCSVMERWNNNSFYSNWRREIRGGVESCEMSNLISILNNIKLNDEPDAWVFSVSNVTEFEVKGVRKFIDDTNLPNSLKATRWNKFVPRKVNIHAWRVLLNKIPTRSNLVSKGIDIPSSLCPVCAQYVECCDHIFGTCDIANKVWSLISKWLQISPLTSSGPTETLMLIDSMRISMEKKRIIELVLFCGWWLIWKHRNDKVFSPGVQRKELFFDFIIAQSYFWYANRCKKNRLSWMEWLNNPLLIH